MAIDTESLGYITVVTSDTKLRMDAVQSCILEKIMASSQSKTGLVPYPYHWLRRIKTCACTGPLFCLLLIGCTKRSFSNWFVEEVSKPNTTTVTAVRLTPDYTILDVQFTNPGKTFYTHEKQALPIGYICVSSNTKLITNQGNRSYSLIKVKGIRTFPHIVRVDPFEQLNFSLYFERLDKGIETFDWVDTIVQDTHTFHYEFPGLYVDNPMDLRQPR